MLFSLPPLRIARLLFELRPETTLCLPVDERGNVLRGAFGTLLQHEMCKCGMPGARQMVHRPDCVYARLFEPRSGEGASFGAETAPRPFLFRPPIGADPEFTSQRPFRFELRLFGAAIATFSHFIRAFQRVARTGLADCAVRLESVKSLDFAGQTVAELFADEIATHLSLHVCSFDEYPDLQTGGPEMTVEFVSPTLLKDGGRDVRVPTVGALVRRVRDRISLLCRIHEGREWQADFGELGRLADQAVTTDWEGSWIQSSRHSTRTGQEMRLAGFRGRVEYANVEPELWPLLAIGQELHVGRHAVWGHGWYRLG